MSSTYEELTANKNKPHQQQVLLDLTWANFTPHSTSNKDLQRTLSQFYKAF